MANQRKPYTFRTSEIDAKILELNSMGFSSRYIAIQCGVSRNVVSDVLSENNRTAMGQSPVPVIWISQTEIQCSQCGAIKTKPHFLHNGRSHHIYSFCNECFQKRRKGWVNGDVERYIAYRLIKCRNEATKKKNCVFTVTKEEITSMYHRQNGCCFYTDVEMLTVRKTDIAPNRLSLDKIIPAFGYISGNVVLCTTRANTVKNNLTIREIQEWLPGWYERIRNKWVSEGKEEWLQYKTTQVEASDLRNGTENAL